MSGPLKNDSGNPATGTLTWDAGAVNSGSAGGTPALPATAFAGGLETLSTRMVVISF